MGTPESFLPYVGRVLFPRRPDDLTSTTQCPACFTPLAGQVCSACGLDLRHPAAAELAALSSGIASSLEQRLELIGRIRFETAAAPAAAAAAEASSPAWVAPAAAAGPVTAPTVAAPAAPPAPAPDAAPRRHVGVQVILLIVGVSLLSVGAIFFLVYAFITFGLVWRSVIIGAVTVAAFAGASLLRRRKLAATAEAIGALAVVFVYLDAFAVRANDLFGAESAEGLTYWGIVLVLSGVGFIVWHRLSGLRVASLVGYTAFGPGVALFLAGVTDHQDAATRVFAAFAGLAAGGLVHLAALRRTNAAVERIVSLSLGVLGLVGAGLAAFTLEPDWQWAPTVGLAVVAVIALVHVILIARTGRVFLVGPLIAALGAIAATAAVAGAAARSASPTFPLIAPVLVAVAIALALEFATRRLPAHRAIALTATISASAVAGLLALPALGTAVIASTGYASKLVHPGAWATPATEFTVPSESLVASVIALAGVVALIALVWAATRVFRARRVALLWGAVAVVVLTVPLLGVLWLVVAGWLVVAAAGVGILIVARLRGVGLGLRLPLALGAGVSLALGYLSSWASPDTWWAGSIATVLVVLVARLATGRAPVRAALLQLGIVFAVIGAAALGWRLNDLAFDGDSRGVEAVHFVAILAIVLLGLSALLRGRIVSAIDSRVLFWSSFIAAGVTATASWILGAAADPADLASLVLPEFGTSLALGIALFAVLLLWVLLPRTSAFPVERVVASMAIAPALAWTVDSLIRVVRLPELLTAIAPISGALLVAAGSLAVAVLRTDASRWARDVGIGLVAVPAVFSSVVTGSDSAWLVLLLAGVTVLLLAVSRDGLVGSASPRKHLGWLALALGTAGLWWRLGDDGVTDLEPYVLPLAGTLLLVALFAWRAGRAAPDHPTPTLAAPAIALGGLLVGILPIAAVSTTGSLPRALAIAGVSVVLLLVGSFGRGTALRPYLDAASIAGALGVATAGFGRAFRLAADGATDNLSLDAWLAGTLLVLLVAAVGQVTVRGSRPALRALIAQIAAGVALATVLVVEVAVIEPDSLGTARAMTLLVLYCAIHIGAFIIDRAPFTRVLAWVAIGLAAATGIAGLARDAIDPLEWTTVPISVALLVTGAFQLRRNAAARSWAWLAPGILVLLLPSLVATFTDQPIWRLVALGVAGILTIVAGATVRLQAPLILGAVIVVVHALRTFAPQIRQVYELTEWWVWAVVGGVILLFLGLTVEKRIRDLRTVGSKISSLR